MINNTFVIQDSISTTELALNELIITQINLIKLILQVSNLEIDESEVISIPISFESGIKEFKCSITDLSNNREHIVNLVINDIGLITINTNIKDDAIVCQNDVQFLSVINKINIGLINNIVNF
jgi:hypothetical protein